MPAYEKTKPVEKMIARVMKKKNVNEREAIAYMLGVATGRLEALWRYEESLPDGKRRKGVFELAGRKKPAAKSPMVSTRVPAAAKPAKRKPATKSAEE